LSLGLPTFNYTDENNKELTLPLGVEKDVFTIFDEERKISGKDVRTYLRIQRGKISEHYAD
jgi:hypothetical protein